MASGIKVFAPASVGNCIVGFDALGLCLEEPGDEIIVTLVDEPGLKITRITGAKGKLPLEVEKNTAGFAALSLLKHLGKEDLGIEMEIHKKMPFGSGLGSSAASAVGGAFAINELLKRPLEKRELLPFAMEGEMLASGSRHADNVAPSLLGGIVLTRDNDSLDVHRLTIPKGLYATVIYPHVEVLTKAARDILSPTVPLKKMVQQSANMAAFVLGLFNGDLDLIKRSLQDVVIEPQRAQLIPHFEKVKNAALEEGALGCSISGAGPSIFALSANSLIAENIGKAMESIFQKEKIETNLYISKINQEGAVKL
jgi:homoserine kinase